MNIIKKNCVHKICMVGFFSIQMALIIGCASVKPMDSETIAKYEIYENFELFKIYQYFVSRDVVLTYTQVDVETDVSKGQAFSSTKTHHDVLQLLASTPGKCLAYDEDSERFRIGIEFDKGSGNLLWFYFDDEDDCFYFDYTDRSKREVEYGGKKYKVSYEEAKGMGATFKRMTTAKKAKGDYQNKEPLLLYEENATQKESEKRKTLGGSKL